MRKLNWLTKASFVILISLGLSISPLLGGYSSGALSSILPTSTEVQDFSAEEIDQDNNGLFDYLELRFEIQSSDSGNLSIEYQFYNEDLDLFHAHNLAESELIPVIPGLNSINTSISNSIMFGLSYNGNLTIKLNGYLRNPGGVNENLNSVSLSLVFDSNNYELPPVYVSGTPEVTLVNLDQNNTLADIIELEIPIIAVVNASIDVRVQIYKRTGDTRQQLITRNERISVTSQTSQISVPFLAYHFLNHDFFDFGASLIIQLIDGTKYHLKYRSIQNLNNVSLSDVLLESFGLSILPNSGMVTELDTDNNGKIDLLGINYTINTTKAININHNFVIVDSGARQIYFGHSVETVHIRETGILEITAYMSVDGVGSLDPDDTVEIIIDWFGSYPNYSQLGYSFSTSLFFSRSTAEYDSAGTSIINDSISLSYIEPEDNLSDMYVGLAIDFDVHSEYIRPELYVSIELFGQRPSGEFFGFASTVLIYGTQYLSSNIYHERIEFDEYLLSDRSIRDSQLNYKGLMQINISSQVWLRWTDDISEFYILEKLSILIEFSLSRDPEVLATTRIPIFTSSPIFSSSAGDTKTTSTSNSYSQYQNSKNGNLDFRLIWIGVGLCTLYLQKRNMKNRYK